MLEMVSTMLYWFQNPVPFPPYLLFYFVQPLKKTIHSGKKVSGNFKWKEKEIYFLIP